MKDQDILKEALETYINHQAMTLNSFFDYHDHDPEVARYKMARAEKLLNAA